MAAKKTPAKKAPAKKKPAETIKALAKVVNLDKSDITSDIYVDRPLIAEKDLSVTVQELCKAQQFDTAAAAIEIAVRRAYHVEAAS